MTARFRRSFAAAALAVGMSVLTAAATQTQSDGKAAAKDVTGSWTLNVQGGPHGATTMGLTLKQDGTAVTGTFASPHGDMPVKGEFVDGTLTLATTGDSSRMTFNATLKEDDTLSGYVSSSMGDMTWTATRAKDK
jgi:hypothetical protein